MIKKLIGWGLVIVLCMSTMLFIGFYQIFIKHCFLEDCAPTRSFTILDIGLPMSLFPSDAPSTLIRPSTETEGALNSGIMVVSWQNGQGRAVYNVWQFGTAGQASRFYKALEADWVHPQNKQIVFASQTADEHNLSCGLSSFGGYRCDSVARYEEFILTFNSTIDNSMSVEQFEELVMFIDAQISAKLYFDLDTP